MVSNNIINTLFISAAIIVPSGAMTVALTTEPSPCSGDWAPVAGDEQNAEQMERLCKMSLPINNISQPEIIVERANQMAQQEQWELIEDVYGGL